MFSPKPPGQGATEQQQGVVTTTVSDTTLSEALITLRKRRWVLIFAIVTGLAYGIYSAMSQPRLYTSIGRIQVRSGSSNEYRVTAATEAGGIDIASRMTTEQNIILSNTIMMNVARGMNLNNNPDFLGVKGPVKPSNLDVPAVREATVHRLHNTLKVGVVPKTDIITISYSSATPKLSADIVNSVDKNYKQWSGETRYASAQNISDWLSNQLQGLKEQVETSQQKMIQLQQKLGILALDPNHNEISAALETLTAAAGNARVSRIIAESRYRVLSGLDPNTIEDTIESTPGTSPMELNMLRGQLATEKANYAQMTAKEGLGPNYPQVLASKAKMNELQREVTAEQNRLLTQAKENLEAAQANERETGAALDEEKANAYKLRDDLVAYTLEQREFETNRALYDGLLGKLRTASVDAGLESMEIDVIDPALPPASPTLQPASTIVLTRLIIGLMAGIVIAFLLESLDTGLRSISEIEGVTELPSLAIIPQVRRMTPEQGRNLTAAQRNIAVLTMPKSQFSESFRSLRTSLMLSTSGGIPPKLILFTSATPSEGKTTTATNLACILAQRETRVLLMDADLRRPNVHHRFGLTGKTGLTTVLAGSTTLEEAVQKIPEVPNLDVLPSGPVPPFPTEMLSSEAMNALLERCAGIYTHIVMDSPPILSVTDGVIMARLADAVVLVVRHGKSSKHVVRRAKDLLVRAGAAVTGVVLNAVDLNSPEYYGYYGYSGYSYTSIDSESWESTVTSSNKRKEQK